VHRTIVETPDFELSIRGNQMFTHAAGKRPKERKASISVESLNSRRSEVTNRAPVRIS
jgi:hypothetical protein